MTWRSTVGPVSRTWIPIKSFFCHICSQITCRSALSIVTNFFLPYINQWILDLLCYLLLMFDRPMKVYTSDVPACPVIWRSLKSLWTGSLDILLDFWDHTQHIIIYMCCISHSFGTQFGGFVKSTRKVNFEFLSSIQKFCGTKSFLQYLWLQNFGVRHFFFKSLKFP